MCLLADRRTSDEGQSSPVACPSPIDTNKDPDTPPLLVFRGFYLDRTFGRVVHASWKAAPPPGLPEREVACVPSPVHPHSPSILRRETLNSPIELLQDQDHAQEGYQGQGAGCHERDERPQRPRAREHRPSPTLWLPCPSFRQYRPQLILLLLS